jgi:hypothetical protein
MGALYKIALPSLAIALALISGCRPAGPLARAGISVTPPSSWRPARPSASKVPGVSLAAWTGPDGSSLVLYRTLPAPGGSAKMIGEALANRLSNLPGLKLVVHRMETVGEVSAARVEVVAPGTGDALAPSGTGTPIAPTGKSLLPTREVTLGFHRPDATLFLTWNIPESAYGRLAPEINATLESVRFAARGTPSFSGY